MLVIAHDPSSRARADRVVRLDGGRVVLDLGGFGMIALSALSSLAGACPR